MFSNLRNFCSATPERPDCLAGVLVVRNDTTRCQKGAKVVVAGRRDEAGKALVKELRSFGSEAECINADVRKEDDFDFSRRLVVMAPEGGRFLADRVKTRV